MTTLGLEKKQSMFDRHNYPKANTMNFGQSFNQFDEDQTIQTDYRNDSIISNMEYQMLTLAEP